MAKSKKMVASKSSDETPTFEESLTLLQQIVEELEEGSLGLDASINRFETGTSLLKACYEMLEGAEQKIEMLTGVDEDGNPTTTEFDATATIERSPKPRRKPADKTNSADGEDPDTDEKTLF